MKQATGQIRHARKLTESPVSSVPKTPGGYQRIPKVIGTRLVWVLLVRPS
jgi:hypothetical protein